MAIRTGNPVFGERAFSQFDKSQEAMTVQGAINKAYILFGLVCVTAIPTFIWASNPLGAGRQSMFAVLGICAVLGLIVGLIASFMPKQAMILGPIYALLEGAVLGTLSGIYNFFYEGIAFQALVLTLGVLFMMLGIYKTGIIQPTEKFKRGMAAGFGALMLFILGSLLFRLFTGGPMFAWASPISIGISVVLVAFAALSLILDFDQIESGAERGAPKYMEWYSAFGLMVTIIWIYLEVLRLLAKLRDR